MCRNIRPLFNFDPPVTDEEINKAVTQFVKKISGFQNPSKINETTFQKAILDISTHVEIFLNNLITSAPPKNRQEEAEKRKKRFLKSQNS